MSMTMDRVAARQQMAQQALTRESRVQRAKQRTEVLRHQLMLSWDKEELRQMMYELVFFAHGSDSAILYEVWNLEAEQALRTGELPKIRIKTCFYTNSADSYQEIP